MPAVSFFRVRPTPVEGGRTALRRLEAWLRQLNGDGPRKWLKRGLWTVGVASALLAIDVVLTTPSPANIAGPANLPQASVVYDANNKIAFTIFKERRVVVPLSAVSPNVIHAVLAIEDQRFYRHYGLDPWRIGGAFFANLRGGGQALQGGSTITQQLARKSFLTDSKSLMRKLREAYLALRIERRFTKDDILALYLNKVYFGNGYYGIEAAARGYFNKNALSLSIEEAALIAGLIKAPSMLAPDEHLERATARRSVVLQQMVDAGFIDQPTATTLAKSPVKLKNGFDGDQTGEYFKNYVTRQLAQQFGWDRLSQGGLRVFATIDMASQAAAEDAMTRGLESIEKMQSFRHLKRGQAGAVVEGQLPKYLQGALVAMDPTSGEVRALVGGRDFDESQFDRATQAERQAGSAFKPFVYAAALESNVTPATLLTDLDTPMAASTGAWLPEDDHDDASSMTVRTALRTSSNRAAVQMLRIVGISRAVTFAQRLGLKAPPVPSLVLGSGEVTPLDMTAAYGAFANGGMLRTPVFIRRVEDTSGKVLFQAQPRASRALSETSAYLMAQMLADVVNAGTGSRAREFGFKYAAGGKTGTTNEYRDAWFIGFTPSLVTTVWVGFDQPQTIAPRGYASSLAVPIWGRFMQQAVRKDAGWVRAPGDVVAVEICRVSGGLPTDACRRAVVLGKDGEPTSKAVVGTEFFRRGTEPVELCPVHMSAYPGNGQSLVMPSHPIGVANSPGSILALPGSAPAPAASKTPLAAPVVAPETAPVATAPPASAKPAAAKPAAPPPSKNVLGKLKSIFGGSGAKTTPPPAPRSGRSGGGGQR